MSVRAQTLPPKCRRLPGPSHRRRAPGRSPPTCRRVVEVAYLMSARAQTIPPMHHLRARMLPPTRRRSSRWDTSCRRAQPLPPTHSSCPDAPTDMSQPARDAPIDASACRRGGNLVWARARTLPLTHRLMPALSRRHVVACLDMSGVAELGTSCRACPDASTGASSRWDTSSRQLCATGMGAQQQRTSGTCAQERNARRASAVPGGGMPPRRRANHRAS
jgi:hypothetical protein